MAKVKSNMKGPFKTVEDLENRCNLVLTDLEGGKLLSLEAIGKADKHVTEGIFEETPGKPLGTGGLKIKLDNGGTDTAWISGVKVKVSFSQEEDEEDEDEGGEESEEDE